MNQPHQPASSCPECGSQRYVASGRRFEMAGYRTFDFYCTMVICGNCGYTAFYAANPGETIATIQRDIAEVQLNQQQALREREEKQRGGQGKKGLFGF